MPKNKTYQLTLKEYERYYNKLYKSLCLFANTYLDNLEMSKDIVQEVFIRIWENRVTFKSEDNVKSYLYTSVKNKSLDYLKSKRYKSIQKLNPNQTEILKFQETESFFLREVVISETSTIIENAIKTLPKKCAQIIRLSVKDFSNIEIAKKLKVSINTVKTQKKIAYKKMKPLLKDFFILLAYFFTNS